MKKAEIVEKIANLLGFEYKSGKWNAFAWYEKYGYHSKDNIFDRFVPQNTGASILKMIAETVWSVTYIFCFGLWLTAAGQTIRSILNWKPINSVTNWIKRKLDPSIGKVTKQKIS